MNYFCDKTPKAGTLLWLFLFFQSSHNFSTHFASTPYFYNPWNHQKTFAFLMFSGGMERNNCLQINYGRNQTKLILVLYGQPTVLKSLSKAFSWETFKIFGSWLFSKTFLGNSKSMNIVERGLTRLRSTFPFCRNQSRQNRIK